MIATSESKLSCDARLISKAHTNNKLDANNNTPVIRWEIDATAVIGSWMVLMSRLTGRLSLLPRGFTS